MFAVGNKLNRQFVEFDKITLSRNAGVEKEIDCLNSRHVFLQSY
jgi:hypothetical protein